MKHTIRAALAFCAAAALTAPAAADTVRASAMGPVAALTVTSSSYPAGSAIPAKFAFEGCGGGAANVSPELHWTEGPAATKSYAVTEFDPDAPTGSGFWHWTLFNLPATTHGLAQGTGTNPAEGTSALNDYGGFGYGGPCPPPGDGPHHYIITVYALDTTLSGLPKTLTGAHLEFAMRGHVIAKGTYVAPYAQAK